MAFWDDWDIDYTNKRVFNKKALGIDGSTTVYNVNALYSNLMDLFDELDQMDDPVPMSAQTPTEYTFINEWFIDDESVKYLKNGAIKTTGYDGKIQVVTMQASGYTNCVLTDIGKTVHDVGETDYGELLAYNNTTRKWWVRGTTQLPTATAYHVHGGTGQGTSSAASVTGEDLYANVYTLGTIATDPSAQVYIFQAGAAIAEWSSLTNWDRGHIDVLIKVKEAGTEIAEAVITVFARQYGDLFDNYEIDLSAGGRNAVPIATSVDLDNPSGEVYLLYDAESTTFVLKEIINGQTSGATAEVIGITDWGTEGCLRLGGIKGTFQDGENLRSGVTVRAVANGTIGGTYLAYKSETVAFTTLGQVITGGTSGAKRKLRGIQDDGTTGKLVLQADVSFEDDSNYYKVYQNDETITGSTEGSATADGASTTLIAGLADIRVWLMNGTIPVEATAPYTVGQTVIGVTTNVKGVVLEKESASLLKLGNVSGAFQSGEFLIKSGVASSMTTALMSNHPIINKAFEAATEKPYNAVVACNGRTLALTYECFKYICREDSIYKMYKCEGGALSQEDGEEYIIAQSGYSPKKASPLGTFAGGVLFGARGIWLEGMAVGDIRNYQLIDADGNTQLPPNKQALQVTALASGDSVSIFRTSGGVINKNLYNSITSGNVSGAAFWYAQEQMSIDTPSSGWVRLVDNANKVEKRYSYTAWTSNRFTLSGALVQEFASGDTGYVPFIDGRCIGDAIDNTVIYTADRPILTRVRRTGIIPFEIAGAYGPAGYTVAAIRTADAIFTSG